MLNLGTEMAGAVATYLLLELFVGRREEREAKKADLIEQLGSRVRDVAVAAADKLRLRGWLSDGSLRDAVLIGANLEGAWLSEANLQGAHLHIANLKSAWLSEANLQGAQLVGANLEGAWLSEANLQGANLQRANLVNAILEGANLTGTDLEGAALIGGLNPAMWSITFSPAARFDENTILSDGTNWTPDADTARFTDPKHPDFWRPDAE
jgi:hypothetical protein